VVQVDTVVHLCASWTREGLTQTKQLFKHWLLNPSYFVDKELLELCAGNADELGVSSSGVSLTHNLKVHSWPSKADEAQVRIAPDRVLHGRSSIVTCLLHTSLGVEVLPRQSAGPCRRHAHSVT
jgi:hypothetical protein